MHACIAAEGGRRCGRPATTGAVFCDVHMKAPPGRRGGWLSAWKRKLAMASSLPSGQHDAMPYTDFSNVAPPSSSMKLYVGSKPPLDRELAFDVVVLCADNYQPQPTAYRGVILRCPIDDGVLSKDEIRRALVTSSQVKAQLEAGRRVLVTCYAGINRSALVAAFALARMTRMTQPEIVAHLRARRNPNCLYNTHFQTYLRRFIEGSRAPSLGRRE